MTRIKNLTSGVWTDPAIWDLGRVPTNKDRIIITNDTRVICPSDMPIITGAVIEFEGMGSVLDTSRIRVSGLSFRGANAPVTREE